MRRLVPLIVDDLTLCVQGLAAQESPIEDDQLAMDLQAQFTSYATSCPSLRQLPPSTPAIQRNRAALIRLYKVPDRGAKSLCANVRSLEKKMCPCCAEPVEPSELDHFVPKDQHPEFSLYASNLIPCCGTCNRRKKKTAWDGSGNRFYLNAYCDAFLDESVYSVKIVPPYQSPEFHFSLGGPQHTNEESSVVRSHFRLLKLEARLSRDFANRFRSVWRRYSTSIQEGILRPEQLSRQLQIEYDCEVMDFGKNGRMVTLLRSIINDRQVLDFVAAEPYPIG